MPFGLLRVHVFLRAASRRKWSQQSEDFKTWRQEKIVLKVGRFEFIISSFFLAPWSLTSSS